MARRQLFECCRSVHVVGDVVYASGETNYIGQNSPTRGLPVHHAVDRLELQYADSVAEVDIHTSASLYRKHLSSPSFFQRESEYQPTGQHSSTGHRLPCLKGRQGKKTAHRFCLFLKCPQNAGHTTGVSLLQDCTTLLAVSDAQCNDDALFLRQPFLSYAKLPPTHVFCSDTYTVKPSETAAFK